jgi:hypothetical protein
MTLSEHAAALGLAQRELADHIDRQSKPERGWNLDDWGVHCSRDVEAARAKRDEVAAEYREAVRLARIALSDRKPGYFTPRREQEFFHD